eukprot:2185603-Ditylum_brightwellii.AAC.2
MGFSPSRADQMLWVKKSEQYHGYDYIATHVDNIIIIAKDPNEYINHTEQHFTTWDVSDLPE